MRASLSWAATLTLISSATLGCNAISGVGDYSVATTPTAGASGAAGSAGSAGTGGTSGVAGSGGTSGSGGAGGSGGSAGSAGSAGFPGCSAKACSSSNECPSDAPLCADMGPDSIGKICVVNVGNNDTACFENEVPVANPDGSQTFVCVLDACIGHNPPMCSAPICTTKDDCFAYDPSTDCVDLSASTNGAVGKRCVSILGPSEFCDPTYLTYSTDSGLACVTGGCAAECQFTAGSTSSTCASNTACDAEGLCIPPSNQDPASIGQACSDFVANGTPCAKSGNTLQGRCVLSGGQLPFVCRKSCALSGDDCSPSEVCFNQFSTSFGICAPTPVCPNGLQDVGEQCDDSNSTNGDGCSSTCKYEVDEIEPNDEFTLANVTSSTSVRGVISPGTDVDFFKFTAPSAGPFTAEVTSIYDATCLSTTSGLKYIDTFIYLVSSGGSQIGSNDDIDPNVNRCSKISANLPAAGEYYVVVFGYDATTEFPYDLKLTFP